MLPRVENSTGRPNLAACARRRSPVLRLVVRCCWLYAAAVLGVWLLLGSAGDRWWPATLAMYGPRWLCVLPLGVLVPAAAAFRRRLLWLLLIALVVVVGPVMGFCVPWHTVFSPSPKLGGIRILTCNTQGDFLNAGALAALIVKTQPDIVVLQEWSAHQEWEVFGEDGWHIRKDGQLCIGSRYPIRAAQSLSSDDSNDLRTGCVIRYELQTPGGVLCFFNVHLASVREGVEEVLADPFRGPAELGANTVQRRRESVAVSRWVAEDDGPVLLAGDFNLPSDSAIFRDEWSGFTDAFGAVGFGWGHTKFTRWHGVRIDHILAGAGWRFRRCWVGPDVQSDHRPLIADVEWIGGSD